MWSELLSWHNLAPPLAGEPMLIDKRVLSKRHMTLHSKSTSSFSTFIEMFSIKWPCRSIPSTGLAKPETAAAKTCH